MYRDAPYAGTRVMVHGPRGCRVKRLGMPCAHGLLWLYRTPCLRKDDAPELGSIRSDGGRYDCQLSQPSHSETVCYGRLRSEVRVHRVEARSRTRNGLFLAVRRRWPKSEYSGQERDMRCRVPSRVCRFVPHRIVRCYIEQLGD